ncbi:MAG: nitroreductase family protein [Desulfurococcales archaeon]|nr:nitroreductase family protein [Desulfurococcales archaeon]
MADISEVIFSRASVRVFKPDLIPAEVISKILEAGVRAPVAGGVEKWFFIVVTSEEKRRKLHELLKEAHVVYATKVLRKPYPEESVRKWVQRMEAGMYYAPAYIAGYIDLREPRHREEYLDEERIFLHQTIAAAFQNMILMAWSLGVGSVWLGVPLFMKEEFNKVLEPPEGLELAGILALGYPTEKPKPKPRKPLNQVAKQI